MIKATAPDLSHPHSLDQWLWRSMTGGTVCVAGCLIFWQHCVANTLAFAPGLGTSIQGIAARDLTAGATILVIVSSLVFRLLAVGGFEPVYQRTKHHNSNPLNRAAYAWWVVAKALMACWIIVDVLLVLGCLLSLSGEGRRWD
ncbi:hypothetical protein [Hymenobacter daeguensis]